MRSPLATLVIGNPHRPTSLLPRLAALLAITFIALCSSISFTVLPLSTNLSGNAKLKAFPPTAVAGTQVPLTWGDSPKRLIVFGDSWSDNGQYPVGTPTSDQTPPRDQAQGKPWTDWLCATISCKHHDNFARSVTRPWVLGDRGAVVDNSLLNSTIFETRLLNHTDAVVGAWTEPVADMRTQVEQWLLFEKQNMGKSRSQDIERKGTVFTIWFSLWDLWYYSGAEITAAQTAVSNTIDVLFKQLDIIAEHWPSRVKVILPKAVDLTFLPGWLLVRTGPQGGDSHADDQRRAIVLVEQWNRVLDRRASQWRKGEIYIYNTNAWLLDQVLGRQLFSQQLGDASGLGASPSPWENVRSGCVAGSHTNTETGDVVTRCPDPSKYLFW
ncbi:MAG: hypothetical protein Q9163_001383 [Psora crenata]